MNLRADRSDSAESQLLVNMDGSVGAFDSMPTESGLTRLCSRRWALALSRVINSRVIHSRLIQWMRIAKHPRSNGSLNPHPASAESAATASASVEHQSELRSHLDPSNVSQLTKTRSPRTLQELIAIMRSVGDEDVNLKAIGAGFAFSNIYGTDGYHVRLTEYLNNPLELDRSILKDATDSNLCRFEGGATIETLTQHLWKQGKALLNQPGYEKLTFIGTANAGGHGSGIGLGPVSDAIRSLHLLTFDEHNRVVQKQIEPANGISHPERFRKTYPQIELIQNDAAFQTATVSMGSIGVIYAATIAVCDAFYLREDREFLPWTTIKEALPKMLADTSLHSFHVWFNPYNVQGKQGCLVSTYRVSDALPLRNPCNRGIGIRMGANQSAINALILFAKHFPKSAPFIIKQALLATASKNVVLPCWQALNLGPPNKLKLTASEYAVDLQHGIAATEALSRAFQNHAAKSGAHLLSPLALRFVKASHAYMSPMHGRDTCMLEMPLLDGLDGREEFLQLFWETLAPFGARPHWGQKNNIDASNVQHLFPKYHEFKAQVRELNKGKLFDSAFTKALGLTQEPASARSNLAIDSTISHNIPTLPPRPLDRKKQTTYSF